MQLLVPVVVRSTAKNKLRSQWLSGVAAIQGCSLPRRRLPARQSLPPRLWLPPRRWPYGTHLSRHKFSLLNRLFFPPCHPPGRRLSNVAALQGGGTPNRAAYLVHLPGTTYLPVSAVCVAWVPEPRGRGGSQKPRGPGGPRGPDPETPQWEPQPWDPQWEP